MHLQETGLSESKKLFKFWKARTFQVSRPSPSTRDTSSQPVTFEKGFSEEPSISIQKVHVILEKKRFLISTFSDLIFSTSYIQHLSLFGPFFKCKTSALNHNSSRFPCLSKFLPPISTRISQSFSSHPRNPIIISGYYGSFFSYFLKMKFINFSRVWFWSRKTMKMSLMRKVRERRANSALILCFQAIPEYFQTWKKA